MFKKAFLLIVLLSVPLFAVHRIFDSLQVYRAAKFDSATYFEHTPELSDPDSFACFDSNKALRAISAGKFVDTSNVSGDSSFISFFAKDDSLGSTKIQYIPDSTIIFKDSSDTVVIKISSEKDSSTIGIQFSDGYDSIGNFVIYSDKGDSTDNDLKIGLNDSTIYMTITGGYGNAFFDDFDRSDDTLRWPWVIPTWAGAGVQIVDSQAYSSNAHSMYDTTLDGDQFCYKVMINTNITYLWVRMQEDTLQGYRLGFVPTNTLRLSKWDGAETILKDSTVTQNANDTMKLYAIADTLYCYVNSILYIKEQDATFSSGYTGIGEQGGISDYWVCGEYGGALDTTYDTVAVQASFFKINSASGQVTVNDAGLSSWEPMHIKNGSMKLSDLEPGEIVFADNDTVFSSTGIGFDSADSSFSFIRIGSGSSAISVLNMSDDTNDTLVLTSGGKTWKFLPVADQ